MDIKTKIKRLIMTLLNSMHEKRKLILALSCAVVFMTTYVLILPAFTLDKEEAAEQGGIDVPTSEQTVDADTASEEVPAEEAKAEASKTEDPKAEVPKENDKANAGKAPAEVTLQNDESDGFSVAVESKDAVLSEDMSVAVREIEQSDKKQKKEYESLYNDALEAVQKAQEEEGLEKPSDFAFAKFYDISLMDGNTEVEPDAAVDVKISFSKDLQKELNVADPERVHIIHFAVDKETGEVTPEVLDAENTDITVKNNKVTEAAFTADSFSVFAVVYTVDFHYEIDGKEYEFTLPGGGFISLETLVEALSVADDTDAFITNVEKVEFSDSNLVWVGKAQKDTTVGKLKKDNNLDCQYSAELTKDQIHEINNQSIKAGEWALISLMPFESEETLTITMTTGEVFTIKVTDDQASDPLGLDGETFVITNGNHDRSLKAQADSNAGSLQAQNPPSSDAINVWKFEYDERAFNGAGGYYLVCTINGNNNYLRVNENSLELASAKPSEAEAGQAAATPFNITFDHDKMRYRISGAADGNSLFLTYVSGQWWENGRFSLSNTKSDNNLLALRDHDHPTSTPGTVGTWDIKSDGIVMKLFDYEGTVKRYGWNGTVYYQDIDEVWGNEIGNNQDLRDGQGINHDRSLLFSGSGLSNDEYFNNFTGSNAGGTYYSGAAYQDIVNYNLGSDHFPVLQSDKIKTTTDRSSGGSLAYLFNDSNLTNAKTSYTGENNSGLQGLLRKDSEGYYYYDSEENFAKLDKQKNEVILYSDTYRKNKGSTDVKTEKIGLFPFDDYQSDRGEEKGPAGSVYHHQFGMSIATDFVYPANGIVPETSKPMTFEFSGDDDVWVFVDGVLVLDLGGVHQPISGKIDFNSGDVTITEFGSNGNEYTSGKSTTIDAMFAKASQEAGKTITFDRSEYSPHKLEFFYLERGGCDSNCKIKFNLITTKSVTLEKKLEGLSAEELNKYKDQTFTFQFCKRNSMAERVLSAYNTGDLENTDTKKNHTIRRDADGNVIEEGFPIKDGLVTMKPGETVTISMLPITADFHVAELDQSNMAAYETPPTGERYLKDEKQENIDLKETVACYPIEESKSWETGTYSVSDTDKVAIINKPLHTNLKVIKDWADGNDKHSSDTIKFTVQATIPGDGEGADPVQYVVSDLKDNGKDKEFEISAAGGWQTTIENLPAKTPDGKTITYTVAEKNVSGYTSEVTQDGLDYTITNTPFGQLKIKKDVTYNNKTPNSEQLETLKGTYKFRIYKDEECKEPYSDDELSITIDENATEYSNVVSLPAGTYWIKEVSGKEGVLPNDNPIEVPVEANITTTKTAIANFTNNKNVDDLEDKIAIELEKQFTGLVSPDDIPPGFKVTLSYKVGNDTRDVELTNKDLGNVGADKVNIDFSESEDHMTWHWRVTHIPTEAEHFSIKEDNYTNNDYTGPTVTLNGDPVKNPSQAVEKDVLKPTITFEYVDQHEITPDSDKNFLFDEDMIWLLRGTANEGIVVSTVHTLSYSTRQAVIEFIKTNEFPQGEWAQRPIHFYSMEEHPRGYAVHGSNIKIVELEEPKTVNGKTYHYELQVGKKQSSLNFYYRMTFDSQSTENSFIYVNDYHQKTTGFEVIKVDKDNHETKLPNAEFALRKVSPVSPFDYIEDESKAITKATSNEGEASFEGLTTGYYEVKETKLPAGYINKGDDTFYIHVTAGEVKMVVKNNDVWSEVTSSSDGKFTFKAASGNDPASITVENEPGVELPHTGGIGASVFYVFGTILVLGCGIYFAARKRMIN